MSKVTEKPFAPACERNQQVILDVLSQVVVAGDRYLLEIGSGTGQHAVFMAPAFPNLFWQTSDLTENHPGIQMWLESSKNPKILSPIHYQAGTTAFPSEPSIDVVFTANTLHIMPWSCVQSMIEDWGDLAVGTRVVIYGPFKVDGDFTSESNQQFDVMLREKCPESGIRDSEKIQLLMEKQCFAMDEPIPMPANNFCLIFKKC